MGDRSKTGPARQDSRTADAIPRAQCIGEYSNGVKTVNVVNIVPDFAGSRGVPVFDHNRASPIKVVNTAGKHHIEQYRTTSRFTHLRFGICS